MNVDRQVIFNDHILRQFVFNNPQGKLRRKEFGELLFQLNAFDISRLNLLQNVFFEIVSDCGQPVLRGETARAILRVAFLRD